MATEETTTLVPAGDVAAKVLIVEDDTTTLMTLEARVGALGYAVRTARNGAEAYALLRGEPGAIDIVLTDFMMPVIDGITLTRRLKRETSTKHIPVVMLTASSEVADVSAGLEAGAFYYLTKPPVEQLLASVLSSAVADVTRQRQLQADLEIHQSAFANLAVAKFRLRLPHEVEPVVSMLASMQDNPGRTIQGIFELVQNAVEHGVLRFGFEAKAKLLRDGIWQDALRERAADPRYASGLVEVTGTRKDDGVYVSVKDNGPGFDWKHFMHTDRGRATAPCGRGISRAATGVFDKLIFDQTGNQVVGFVANSPPIRW